MERTELEYQLEIELLRAEIEVAQQRALCYKKMAEYWEQKKANLSKI